jgi:hypothetical protein
MYAVLPMTSARRDTAETAISATVAHSVVSTTRRLATLTSVSASPACCRIFMPELYDFEFIYVETLHIEKYGTDTTQPGHPTAGTALPSTQQRSPGR